LDLRFESGFGSAFERDTKSDVTICDHETPRRRCRIA
jgi:hypothetical protein